MSTLGSSRHTNTGLSPVLLVPQLLLHVILLTSFYKYPVTNAILIGNPVKSVATHGIKIREEVLSKLIEIPRQCHPEVLGHRAQKDSLEIIILVIVITAGAYLFPFLLCGAFVG